MVYGIYIGHIYIISLLKKFTLLPTVRFDEKDSVSGVQQLKSSVQKGIRSKLLELYPHLESHIDLIIPKKDSFRIVKW